MKRVTSILFLLMVGLISQPAYAALNVFSCEPAWKALAEELGHDKVKAYSATTAFQDPHHIEARPSLIAKVRRADLVICSGAELEIGWLPLLLRQAGNDKVQESQPGYFMASDFVKRLDIPTTVDRSMGDVHAEGNPHIQMDPRRIAKVAGALAERLSSIDPQNADTYSKNLDDFLKRWQAAIQRWQKKAAVLNGVGMITHHKGWVYLFDWLNIKLVGTLEPKPGIPATASHMVNLKRTLKQTPAKEIIYSSYQSPRAAKRFSELTGLPAVMLPFTVGGTDKASNLFGFFDDLVDRLTSVIK